MDEIRKHNQKPTFLGVPILARHNPNAGYTPDNCFFRTAVSEEEARQGIELYVGADLRERILDLERHGWIRLDAAHRREVMRLGEQRGTED